MNRTAWISARETCARARAPTAGPHEIRSVEAARGASPQRTNTERDPVWESVSHALLVETATPAASKRATRYSVSQLWSYGFKMWVAYLPCVAFWPAIASATAGAKE